MKLPELFITLADSYAEETWEETRLPVEQIMDDLREFPDKVVQSILEVGRIANIIPACFQPTDECALLLLQRVLHTYASIYASSFGLNSRRV